MAMANVENMTAVNYHGITVYHTYKDDYIDQPIREFTFTLDSYGSELSDDAFDVRDLEGYDPQQSTAANLVQMIDAGLFGESNLIEREAKNQDDTYDAADTSESTCPVCGAKLTEYGSLEVHDTQIEYPFTCENCGVSGSEWGSIVFDGYSVP